MRRIIAVLMLCILLINLTACYDADEIDEMVFVVALGIDKGKSDKLRLTLQLPTVPENGGSGQEQSGAGGGQNNFPYVSVDAPSFFTGIDMLNAALPKKLDFTQMQIIYLGEEFVKDGEFAQYIAPLGRFVQLRRSAHLHVINGTAFDFIKDSQPFLGVNLYKGFQLFFQIAEDTGFTPHVIFEEFYESLKSPSHQAIVPLAAINDFKSFKKNGESWGTKFKSGGYFVAGNLPRMGENAIELFGTAIFNDSKMVGKLTGEETRFLLMARGEFKRGFFTMPDPKKPEFVIPLDVRMNKHPEIKVSFLDTTPVIKVKVYLDGDLLAVQSMIDYEKAELKPLLEQKFTRIVQTGIEELIRKCQGWNSDAFRFGDYAARNFYTIDGFEKYNWNDRFKDAQVTVDVEFVIRRTGIQIKSSPLKGDEDK